MLWLSRHEIFLESAFLLKRENSHLICLLWVGIQIHECFCCFTSRATMQKTLGGPAASSRNASVRPRPRPRQPPKPAARAPPVHQETSLDYVTLRYETQCLYPYCSAVWALCFVLWRWICLNRNLVCMYAVLSEWCICLLVHTTK